MQLVGTVQILINTNRTMSLSLYANCILVGKAEQLLAIKLKFAGELVSTRRTLFFTLDVAMLTVSTVSVTTVA